MQKLSSFVLLNILSSNVILFASEMGGGSKNIEFDTISVTERKLKDEVYTKSGALSVRDEINKKEKDLDAVIRSVPGAFTQMNKSAGAVSVNIRGGTGFGRVNTMVDGVSQTFYSSGGDTGGKGGAGSQFGAAIDPAFLTSVEVDRGSFKGSGGSNSLMGSANFKTIGVNDIVMGDNYVGGMLKYVVGTNDTKPEYTAALAAKYPFSHGGWLGFLYGYSYKTITQNYKVGGGETHESIARPYYEAGVEEAHKYCRLSDIECIQDELRKHNITPYDPNKVKQRPQNHLLKMEYVDDYNNLELQYRNGTNHLAGRKILTDTKQINYNFALPDSNLVDLNLLYSLNSNRQVYDKGSTIINRTIAKELVGTNKSKIFDISNTFEFSLPKNSTISFTPGFNKLVNKYSRNRYPDELRIFKICEDKDDDSEDCLVPSGELNPNSIHIDEIISASLPTNSFFPQGRQDFKTLYLDNRLEWNIFTIDYNVNLVNYKHKGQILKTPYQEHAKLEELYQLAGDKNDKALMEHYEKLQREMVDSYGANPKPNIDDVDEDGDPLYDDEDDYNEELIRHYYTAPKFKAGTYFTRQNKGKQRFINHSLMITAGFNEYFSPFIGHSKTHRAPTIQEMYFSSLGDAGVNLNLKPEKAKTMQIGFNGFIEGAFKDNDKLGYKFTRYKTDIDNFIHNVSMSRKMKYIKLPNGQSKEVSTIFHINQEHEVNIKGFEFELSYDMGVFYANLAYARQKTNQPASYSDISRTASNVNTEQAESQSFGLTKVTILPDSYGSLELGTRFFNEKLTIGGVAKYFGKSKKSKYKPVRICKGGARIIEEKEPGFEHQIRRFYCPGEKDASNVVGKIAEYEEVQRQPMVYDMYVMYEPSKNFSIRFAIDNITDVKYANPLDANNDSASQYITGIHRYTKNFSPDDAYYVQNNFARGRTAKLNFTYKF